MRRLKGLVVFVLLFTFCAGVVQAAAKEGTFVLFLGGTEAGREEYSFSPQELRTEGSISVGAQCLKVTSSLQGSGGQWSHYQVAFTPGASLSVTFGPGKMEAEVGPLRRTYALDEPFVILENNVFAHFEQILTLFSDGGAEQAFAVVVPSLILANQNPVLSGSAERRGAQDYQLQGAALSLEEYIVSLPGNLQVRLLAEGDRLISLEIPMQGVQVLREGYVGLQPAVAAEPQPSHYRNEDFQVRSGDVTLAGTLSLPRGEGPFPAVLLNSGSGPQDRDGNSPPSLQTYMFKILAERLTAAGIAVLRYDERGVGESTGDYAAADLNDLLSDVEALLDFLAAHPQIDPARLAMLGHSEGAYFAPLFHERLSAVVLLAGPSIPLDELMLEQLDYQIAQPWLSEQEQAYLKGLKQQVEVLLQEAREGKEVSTGLAANLDWIRQHMELRPLENLAKVKSPVLIVQGEDDLQVMPYHAQELAKCLREAGNDQVTLELLPETSHTFTFAHTSSKFDPLQPFQLNPELIEIVTAWLAQQLN
ncbi:MAG TPA: alpha/beta fold hydrolase [Limnochordia bacterium]|nr:alpha/beta fold hydrolase [Limnochordia bacterium]